VIVSTGREQIDIPDVTGFDSDEAFAVLGDAGFAVRESSESSNSVDRGKVVRTDPAAGTPAARGSTVRMFVSSGSPTVEVPEVRGQTLEQAQATLSDRGLTSSTIQQEDPANAGKVLNQSPSAGARVSPGANIVLTVGTAGSSTTTTSSAAPGP
jgi:eukaryotic-like serine/threonine-protein kinase